MRHCRKGPGAAGGATHPILALGVHETSLQHIQGLAQECGTSTLREAPGSWLCHAG